MSHYFWTIFTPPPLSHILEPQKVCHTSRTPPPQFLVGLVQKPPDKSPLYKFSLNCSRGLCPGVCLGVFCMEGFVWGGFCPVPLLSEYICYKRQLNTTLNFMFHMYDKKFISVASHALDPLPRVARCPVLDRTV